MHGRRRTGCEELQVEAVLTVDCKSAALLLEEPGATAARLLRAWSARQQSAGDLPQYRQIVVHGAGGIQGEPVRGPRAPHRTVAARAPTAPGHHPHHARASLNQGRAQSGQPRYAGTSGYRFGTDPARHSTSFDGIHHHQSARQRVANYIRPGRRSS